MLSSGAEIPSYLYACIQSNSTQFACFPRDSLQCSNPLTTNASQTARGTDQLRIIHGLHFATAFFLFLQLSSGYKLSQLREIMANRKEKELQHES